METQPITSAIGRRAINNGNTARLRKTNAKVNRVTKPNSWLKLLAFSVFISDVLLVLQKDPKTDNLSSKIRTKGEIKLRQFK
jgi:hypothetical protein